MGGAGDTAAGMAEAGTSSTIIALAWAVRCYTISHVPTMQLPRSTISEAGDGH